MNSGYTYRPSYAARNDDGDSRQGLAASPSRSHRMLPPSPPRRSDWSSSQTYHRGPAYGRHDSRGYHAHGSRSYSTNDSREGYASDRRSYHLEISPVDCDRGSGDRMLPPSPRRFRESSSRSPSHQRRDNFRDNDSRGYYTSNHRSYPLADHGYGDRMLPPSSRRFGDPSSRSPSHQRNDSARQDRGYNHQLSRSQAKRPSVDNSSPRASQHQSKRHRRSENGPNQQQQNGQLNLASAEPAGIHREASESQERRPFQEEPQQAQVNHPPQPSETNPTTAQQDSDETHIIFSIDFSSSMNKKDAQKGKQCVSRWDAVFECVETFLLDQLKQQSSISSDDVVVVEKSSTALVSVIIFNDDAAVLLERMPLLGDGQKVLSALKLAHEHQKPKGGTGFSAGLQKAQQVAATANEMCNANVVVVFLSDGRPGDLKPAPPCDPNTAMQDTFRRNGEVFPAAGCHIEKMKKVHGDRLSLHFISMYKEGKPWLEYLAKRYDGTFHEPILSIDDDSGGHTPQLGEVVTVDDSSDDEEIVELEVKSQDTVIRERHHRALAAGSVISLTATTHAGASTMRSTFQSISSSVTAMRAGTSSKLAERKVVLAPNSTMIQYDATRMVLSDNHEKITVPTGEKIDGRKVRVSMHPFAQGGLRNVYHLQQTGETRQVAKESRFDTKYQERLKFHIETSKCQARAADYAEIFNAEAKKKGVPKVDVLRAEVIRLRAPRCPGGFRYLAVEKALNGTYKKFNSNNGWVADRETVSGSEPTADASVQWQVAQAFSHFSYERSNKVEMVVDVQGSGFVYTDPQLHSVTKEFGRADRGNSGMRDFFETHKCNDVCKRLGLASRSHSHVMKEED